MNPSYETIAAQSGHYPFVEVYQFLGADVYQFTGAGDTFFLHLAQLAYGGLQLRLISQFGGQFRIHHGHFTRTAQ
jgi:hypothetical protein